ncbi:hypothetical protein BX600DRAFT_437531 [Xylariales sp. PMI_506]|nr:hypothetical protein BX600DRAFT_437531 [Xylariales sp. PMI_506]
MPLPVKRAALVADESEPKHLCIEVNRAFTHLEPAVPRSDETFATNSRMVDETIENQGNLEVTECSGRDLGSTTNTPMDISSTPRQAPESNKSNKKPLSGYPPVHAYTRSALADSLGYFRSHESGNYHKDGVTQGLLISKESSCRDYIDESVIITIIQADKIESGGGRETTKEGRLIRTTSQDETSISWKCLSEAKNRRQSVVVIISNENTISPTTPRFPFCVMAHFQITDIWSEVSMSPRGERVAFWMTRLEKIPSSGPSWWAGGHAMETPDDVAGLPVCQRQTCDDCGTTSKHIYNQGWTCLNHRCVHHFQFSTPIELDEVSYTSTFLRERSESQEIHQNFELIPGLPNSHGTSTYGTEKEFKRGIVCPHCHCASRRIDWQEWKCENNDCDFTHSIEFREYPITSVQAETKRAKSKMKVSAEEDLITRMNTTITGYPVEMFTLPGEDGTTIGMVLVFRATQEICELPKGPNDIFRALQRKDLKLRRSPARAKGARNEELCSHFTSNWGAHYKYGVFVETVGFNNAPEEILRCVSQLTWAQGKSIEAIPDALQGMKFDNRSMALTTQPFNELLSLGYFESSTISWHDDGEKELGPTVATLSVGSPSVMRFRPKKNCSIGTAGKNKKGVKPPVLSFPLFHGDICVMHGTTIHKLYEHEVKPHGKLRFAMTSRFVRPESIADRKIRQESIRKGKLPEGFDRLAYGGIENNKDTDNDVTRTNGDTSQAEVGDEPTIDIDDQGASGLIFSDTLQPSNEQKRLDISCWGTCLKYRATTTGFQLTIMGNGASDFLDRICRYFWGSWATG